MNDAESIFGRSGMNHAGRVHHGHAEDIPRQGDPPAREGEYKWGITERYQVFALLVLQETHGKRGGSGFLYGDLQSPFEFDEDDSGKGSFTLTYSNQRGTWQVTVTGKGLGLIVDHICMGKVRLIRKGSDDSHAITGIAILKVEEDQSES